MKTVLMKAFLCTACNPSTRLLRKITAVEARTHELGPIDVNPLEIHVYHQILQLKLCQLAAFLGAMSMQMNRGTEKKQIGTSFVEKGHWKEGGGGEGWGLEGFNPQ
eukprot:528094-Pelagomonas_calceolata.AAC.3